MAQTELCDLSFDEAPLADFLHQFYNGRIPAGALSGAHYRVVACDQCEFVYQASVLDEAGMESLYEDWIDQDASLAKKQRAGHRLYRQQAGQIQSLQRLLPGPPAQTRVLDFGSGWGYWARMARAHGFDASGFELSTRRRAYAEAQGVPCLDALPDVPTFDCIVANQVLEHLTDPVATLQQLSACLKPDGLLYLRVPDGRGIRQALSQRGWSPELNAIHPLEHVNCFTRGHLIQMAASLGYSPQNPPVRLNWGSLVGGIRREIVDRWLAPHVLFRRQ